jgi:hypothetical protein
VAFVSGIQATQQWDDDTFYAGTKVQIYGSPSATAFISVTGAASFEYECKNDKTGTSVTINGSGEMTVPEYIAGENNNNYTISVKTSDTVVAQFSFEVKENIIVTPKASTVELKSGETKSISDLAEIESCPASSGQFRAVRI